MAQHAAAAKASGFSAVRGQALHTQSFSGGKPDTPSAPVIFGKDTRSAGRALTGKTIEPVAVSVTPTRYTDPAKVEKWFKRNCTEVLGRVMRPQEKGDWLTFVTVSNHSETPVRQIFNASLAIGLVTLAFSALVLARPGR
ncbi:MAG: DUF1924 domain-containing protein [Rhodocyclaceae bacterium]